jgi:hypothetical protein
MRRFGAAVLASLTLALAFGSTALASYGGSQLSGSACSGKQVINVTEKVVNDADSAVGGTFWALDSFTRQIQVSQVSATSFCATVSYEGGFVTFAGNSPSGAGEVSAGIKGTMSGGYVATFDGTMLASPAWKTKGSVGTVDYQCDQLDNCPGYVDWVAQFFGPGYTNFDQPYWGWEYKTAKNGSWINASAGNSGDITG